MILLQLFLSFLHIGLFSIGGGMAAVPLVQAEVVASRGWLTMTEFTDLITIAEMTPRQDTPISECCTPVQNTVRWIWKTLRPNISWPSKAEMRALSAELFGSSAFWGSAFWLNVIIVMTLAIGMFIYLRYSKHGYEISVLGESQNTARYAGIKLSKVFIRTMALSAESVC